MIDILALRQALAAHLGAELTPDVAAEIVRTVHAGVDRSIPLAQFPIVWGGDDHYTFAAESFRAIKAELHPLHERHFAETERYRAHLGLNPDYDALERSERDGTLLQLTMRDADDGTLVGNIRFYIGRSRHTSSLFAQEDTYYVAPEHRKGLVALAFWRFGEDCLRRLGVVEIRTDSKLPTGAEVNVLIDGQRAKGVSRLNQRMGYQPVALKHVKTLQGEANVR